MPNQYTSPPIEERFWAKVNTSGDCWTWTAFTNDEGYGHFSVNGKNRLAHRVSWELHHGPIPEGMYVLHSPVICHNPACVNPDHLRLGTDADNQYDRIKDGTDCRGETIGNSKLTEADVIAIRKRYAAGGITQSELGREYGVSNFAVSRIVKRNRWKHVR